MRSGIELSPANQKIFLTLVLAEITILFVDALVTCCGFVTYKDMQRLLDITKEGNIPTWFSSIQLLATGLVAYLISRGVQADHNSRGILGARFGWGLIAAFFVFMSMDDAAQFHERVATFLSDIINASSTQSVVLDVVREFPSYYWQIIFLPLFGGMGLYMLVFLLKGLDKNHILFLSGIGCYVLAVGLDYFDGIDRNYDVIIENTFYSLDEARHIFRAVEEFIEMLGTTLFLITFTEHYNHSKISDTRR